MARLIPLWLLQLLLLLGLVVVLHAHVPPNLKDLEVNADGTTVGSTSRFNKKIDVEAMERQWQDGDSPFELEHEQMHFKKIQEEKLKEGGGTKTDSSSDRLSQIDKATAVDVQFYVELQKPAKAGMKSDWKQNQAHMLGVKWRQILISAGQSVSYNTVPVFKKVIKKIKGKKKKQQINNILVVFTVEKGYQTVDIIKYLLKQPEVAKISMDDQYYTIDDLTKEEQEDIVRNATPEEEEEEEEPLPPPVDTNKNKKKKPTKSPTSKQNQPASVPATSTTSYPANAGLVEVDQNGNPKQQNNVLNSKSSPQVHDPLHVNRDGDEAAFGIQLYAELRMERTKGVGWTMPQGDVLAKTWTGLLSTTYPGTKVSNYGHIGPPPTGSTPPPPRETPPGMTLMVTVEGGWKTYDVLKFLLVQKETDCVTVHGKTYTKKDLPADEIDEDDD